MHNFLKESSLTFISRILVLIISLISNIIISRILGPSLKGTYSLTLLVINVTSLVITFGIGPSNVYYGARKPFEIPALLGNSILAAILFGLSGIIVGELITFLPPIKFYLISNGVYINWLRCLILFLPLVLLKFYLPELVRAAGKIFSYNLLGVCETFAGLVAAITLVWLLNMGLNGAIATWIISIISALFFCGLLLAQISSHQIQIDLKMLRRNLAFGIKLYPGHIAQFLNYRIDVFLVAFFLGPKEVGLYVTATVLVEKLWEIPNAISTILLYKVAANENNSILITTARISRIFIFLLGGLCTILAFLSYYLIHLFFGAAFQPAASAMIFLLPGIWLLGIAKLLVTYLTGIGKPETGSLAAIISLFATIIFDLTLIPKLGIIGASIASSCSYIVSLCVIRKEDFSLLYNSIGHYLISFISPYKKKKENSIY